MPHDVSDAVRLGRHLLAQPAGQQTPGLVIAAGFSLGYSSYPRGWSFGMHPTDSQGGGGEGYLVADPVPQAGVWTHLAGVCDHAGGTISLYVNGRLAKSMARPSTWYATGALIVGRGKNDGWWVDHWPGEIDDVRPDRGPGHLGERHSGDRADP